MKDTLQDLNSYLFEELERLNDDETMYDERNFSREIRRAKAISSISQCTIQNANTILHAIKLQNEYNINNNKQINRYKYI